MLGEPSSVLKIHFVHDINIDNPISAFTIYDEIQKQICFLCENPFMGRPGRVSGTRELKINRTPFIVAYFIRPSFLWPNLYFAESHPTLFLI